MIAPAMQYRFGPFVADRGAYQLRRGDRPVEVTPKLLDLLFHLLERPATLVTKEELLDAVWPGANVTDNALAQAVSELREALGDSASSPTYIRTIARRGYRFIAPVEAGTPRAAAAVPVEATPAPRAAGLRTLAVLDFENLSGDADVAWLSVGIAETVTNDLSALGGFRIVDRLRVVSAMRSAGRALHEVGAAVGAALLVTGSYQRHGQHVRITARVVDLDRGEAVADAKVDGPLAEIFRLQDEVVAAFARELGLGRFRRPAARETSNLEAYRAYFEGWVKLESLDTNLVPAARADFERAIAADPSYAMAYTGLAHAEFVAYEMTRVAEAPDVDALASGLAHARRAVELEPDLPEALATHSFLLSSSLAYEEARAAAQKAAALEPENWRHQFRLGHASWGAARERALRRALALFPNFPYALLELAFLEIARGRLDEAAALARQGAIEQDHRARLSHRYPAVGFHWLTGALESAADRHNSALRHFARELTLADRRKLYGPEYAAASLVSRGHAELALGQPDVARESFCAAREHIPGLARAWLGEAVALEALGQAREATGAWAEADATIDRLRRAGREPDACYNLACREALRGRSEAAAAALETMLGLLPPCQHGWSISIEPCFRSVRARPEFEIVISRLAERAR